MTDLCPKRYSESSTVDVMDGADTMQHKMMTHQLPKSEMDNLLMKNPAGVLSTIDPDGTPYGIPIHFVLLNDAIYLHCLPAGQKLDNLNRDPRVCLTVYQMDGLKLDPQGRPCNTGTKYSSVIVRGKARIISDITEKRNALNAIVDKLTPQNSGKEIPDNMLDRTAVVRIDIDDITGKYDR